MRLRNGRTIAVTGVLLTAVMAAFLVSPAARQLGTVEGLALGAAIFGLPILVLLIITGAPYYGAARAVLVAVVIAVISSVVMWVVAVFTFATALSGSVTGIVLAVVLFGVPALTVALLGLLALRLLPSRDNDPSNIVSGAPPP